MKDVTVVTGPLRSGTSSVIGLLERCGFDLGNNIRVLREPTEHNPKGHFELDLLYAINERLLKESGIVPGSITRIPDESLLAEIASKRENYFRIFLRKFNGELCKDPLMCLTLPFWKQYWPEMQRVVYCLRHPLAAAHSMEKRYGISLKQGLSLWHTYTSRFFNSTPQWQLYIFNYDAFCGSPCAMLSRLLRWLDRPIPDDDIQKHLEGFFDGKLNHWNFGEEELRDIPGEIRRLYLDLRSHAEENRSLS